MCIKSVRAACSYIQICRQRLLLPASSLRLTWYLQKKWRFSAVVLPQSFNPFSNALVCLISDPGMQCSVCLSIVYVLVILALEFVTAANLADALSCGFEAPCLWKWDKKFRRVNAQSMNCSVVSCTEYPTTDHKNQTSGEFTPFYQISYLCPVTRRRVGENLEERGVLENERGCGVLPWSDFEK